jgi:hypothetical protein
MSRSPARFLIPIILPLVTSCVHHAFAPGPGQTAWDFEPDAAKCRLFARGAGSGYSFAAAGSPRFVASYSAGAALGVGIASAIEQNENFNDCMQARGWRIADGKAPVPEATLAIPIPAAPLPSPPPTASVGRRNFGVRASMISPNLASDLARISHRG